MHENETYDRVISELASEQLAIHTRSDTVALAAGGSILEELFVTGWRAEALARELGARGVQVGAATIRRARYMRRPDNETMAPSQHLRNENIARLLHEISQLPAPPRRVTPAELLARVDQFRALVRSGTRLKEIVARLNAEGKSTTVDSLKYVMYRKRAGNASSAPADQADAQVAAGDDRTPSWLQKLNGTIQFDEDVWRKLINSPAARADLIRKAILSDDREYLAAVAQAYSDEPAIRAAIYAALRSFRTTNAREVYLAMLEGPPSHAQFATDHLSAHTRETSRVES